MKVIWMEQAEEALNRTVKYICSQFGSKASKRLLKETYSTGCRLEENPYLGSIEPLMAHRRPIVVNRLNKIVYRVVDDRIEIADFWDTRREPQNQADKTK
jgi:plasmid stabilization system protein ParE